LLFPAPANANLPDQQQPKSRQPSPLVITPARPSTVERRIKRGSHAGLHLDGGQPKTRHLDFEQVANLVNAVAYAKDSGNQLTVAMTLLWPHVAEFREFGEARLSSLTTRLLDRLSRWLRRHANIELHAIWTRERGYNKGHHINIMANIPVRLLPKLGLHLTKSFEISERGLHFEYGTFGLKALPMQMGNLRYICKSLDHNAFVYRGWETYNIADILEIRHVGTDGPIRIKRAGTTQNLGRKARRAAPDWNDARSIEEVADSLNPNPFRPKKAPQCAEPAALKNNQWISNARR
jgi:hypothetical protein